MFKDNSGMFKDFGFKLIVINSLLGKENSFSQSLSEMKSRHIDTYKGKAFSCVPQMVEYFENLILTPEDLKMVDELCFDGGNEIYFYIMPDRDGESSEFDVHSIDDFKSLPNLERVDYISMCNPQLMDVFRKNHITMT